ncbi:MAG TPA: ribbon-helix-helix protein, CopG family [Mycobacterium sp.]|nr:ribbon-helix-helix protein, CopG family [Mycobacterium sp.]
MPKFTVEMNDELDAVVTSLAEQQGVPKTQVVRRALALLKYLEDQRRAGNVVLVQHPETGREKEVVFEPLLSPRPDGAP